MATTAVKQNRVRIAGAGFTLFSYGGQIITFCNEVQYQSPRPVAAPSFIQPLDEPYAVEILIPPAASPGTMVLEMFELFGSGGKASKAWDRLGANIGTRGTTDPFGPVQQGGLANTSPLLTAIAGGGPYAGAVDIVDLFIRQARLDPTQMHVSKIIRPLSAGVSAAPYTEDYIGATIVDVEDGETVAVGTKEVLKRITIAFRYVARNGKPSQAFNLRAGGTPVLSTGLI